VLCSSRGYDCSTKVTPRVTQHIQQICTLRKQGLREGRTAAYACAPGIVLHALDSQHQVDTSCLPAHSRSSTTHARALGDCAGGALQHTHGIAWTILILWPSVLLSCRCPPCRAFTPKLANTYSKLRKDGRQWEVVFVSMDRNPVQFQVREEEAACCCSSSKSRPWVRQ
jgi:hypothetical protein